MEKIVQEYISKPNLGFEFTYEQRGEAAVFRCSGALSLGSYPDLKVLIPAIVKTKGKTLVLDMREVAHIDSAGIGTIATIFKEAQAAGREFRIVPSTPVRLALGLAKIDTLIRLDDSVESALS